MCGHLLLGVLTSTSAVAATGETWEVQGKTYADVRVRQVTDGTVMILCSSGLVQLDLAKLPGQLQVRFGYDEEKARRWRANADAGLASSQDTKRRIEAQRTAAAKQTTLVRTSPGAVEIKGPVPLHDSVDLRPIYQQNGLYLRNQGRRPSCAVFAIVGALEYEIARRRGRAEPLSEEFLIWAARRLQPDIPLDDGFHFSEVLSALQSFGIPRQATMHNSFGKSMEDIHPSPEALSEAPMLHSVVPVWIRANDPLLTQRLVTKLNEATPVVIGLKWPNWKSLEHTALLSEQQPMHDSGHAVTLIGYKSDHGNPASIVFLFRNSYGVQWGSGGYGYVTVDYLRRNIIESFYLTLPDESGVVAAAP